MATWRKNLQLADKDPYDEIDIVFSWGTWLAGANITVQDVTGTNVTVASSAIEVGNQSVTSRVTGGTAGTQATVTCQITTDEVPARKVERSVGFAINEL